MLQVRYPQILQHVPCAMCHVPCAMCNVQCAMCISMCHVQCACTTQNGEALCFKLASFIAFLSRTLHFPNHEFNLSTWNQEFNLSTWKDYF